MLRLVDASRRLIFFVGFSVLTGCGSSDGAANVLTTLSVDGAYRNKSVTLTWSSTNATVVVPRAGGPVLSKPQEANSFSRQVRVPSHLV